MVLAGAAKGALLEHWEQNDWTYLQLLLFSILTADLVRQRVSSGSGFGSGANLGIKRLKKENDIIK